MKYVPTVVWERYFKEYMKGPVDIPIVALSKGLEGIELDFFNFLVEKYKDVDFVEEAKDIAHINEVWRDNHE